MESMSASTFAHVFRAEAYIGVEYSFDDQSDCCSVMVAGKAGFMDQVQRFAAGLPFVADWAWAMKRFTDYVHPDAYLLRLDHRSEQISAMTLYCRFPIEPDKLAFKQCISMARPLEWSGPSPDLIASSLGLAGPRGIGFRIDTVGNYHSALYYRLTTETTQLDTAMLPELVQACGLPADLATSIAGDIRPFYRSMPVGVIGVDAGSGGVAKALKFDPANVPLRQAFAFLAGKGVSRLRIAELSRIAGTLRAEWLSYLGIKYGPNGFAGWRVYFSVQPSLLSPPLATRLVIERSAIPTLRLPHY